MRRFILLLRNEFALVRTALPIHIVAILQPAVMYLLMASILVHPTFDMNVVRPTTAEGHALVAAMRQVGSPIGLPYIEPILVDDVSAVTARQVIAVETVDGAPTALQRYGLIDSNLVKNLRNRLTAAALRLWNAELGDRAVTVEEHPWLGRDVPYTVYFGMAMLPMAAYVAAALTGSVLTRQDFDQGTILEYRLAPIATAWVLAARLVRLVLTALVGAGVLFLAVGLVNGAWPAAPLRVLLALCAMGLVAASVSVSAGLLVRHTIPAFVVALTTSFACWLLGSAFGLPAGFGRLYQLAGRLMPNTYAVEILFPSYYGIEVGTPWLSALILTLMSAGALVLTTLAYRQRVRGQE